MPMPAQPEESDLRSRATFPASGTQQRRAPTVMKTRGKYDLSVQEMLLRSFPALLRWLLPDAISAQKIRLPRELPATARQADLIIRVKYRSARPAAKTDAENERILLIEFQVQRDPKLHHAMLLRAALAHSLYRRRVKTLVLALTPQAVVPTDHVFGEGPAGNAFAHQVTVREVFRESAEGALASGISEILPLVATMQPQDGNHAALLSRIVERIVSLGLDKEQQTMMLEQTTHLATLHLPRTRVDGIVQTVLRRGPIMLNFRDLPYAKSVYREGKAEGKAQGKAEGEAKGKAEGEAKGKAESVVMVLEARGILVAKALRDKILSCTEPALLDQWLRRATSAKSAGDVLGAN